MEATSNLSLATAPAADRLRSQMKNPLLLPLFMLAKLPMGVAAGLRIRTLDAERCTVTVPHRWRNKNPFGSMYFAVQAMAAEMSTGAPALVACRAADPPVRSLITGMTSEFLAQGVDTVTFACDQVGRLTAAVEEAHRSGDAVKIEIPVVGTMPDGTVVSRFSFTWSFKRARKR